MMVEVAAESWSGLHCGGGGSELESIRGGGEPESISKMNWLKWRHLLVHLLWDPVFSLSFPLSASQKEIGVFYLWQLY